MFDHEGESHQGVNFHTPESLFNFWWPVVRLCETHAVEIEGRSVIGCFTLKLIQCEWIKDDVGIPPTDNSKSFYQNLFRTMLSLIVTLAEALSRETSKKPSKRNLASDFDRRLLMGRETAVDPTIDRGILISSRCEQLPIKSLSLSEWKRDLESSGYFELLELDELDDSEDDDSVEGPDTMHWDQEVPFEVQQTISQDCAQTENGIKDRVKSELAEVSPFFLCGLTQWMIEAISPENLMSLETARPLNLTTPYPTAFAIEMSKYSIFGQTRLMLQYIDAKKQHVHALVAGLRQILEILEDDESELLAKKDVLTATLKAYTKSKEDVENKQHDNDKLRKECDELESMPGVKTIINLQQKFSNRRGLVGPTTANRRSSTASAASGITSTTRKSSATNQRPPFAISDDEFSDIELPTNTELKKKYPPYGHPLSRQPSQESMSFNAASRPLADSVQQTPDVIPESTPAE